MFVSAYAVCVWGLAMEIRNVLKLLLHLLNYDSILQCKNLSVGMFFGACFNIESVVDILRPIQKGFDTNFYFEIEMFL